MKIFLFVFVLLFVNSIFAQNCCCNIVQSVFGLVEAENRTIFKIYYPFSFDLCLVSTVGDADLYVSDRNPSPSYDINSYLLHSATCGDDVIHVHKSLKRPIYVSVFGHPSFTVSHFYVNIVARESSEEDIINLQLLDLEDSKNISVTPVDDGDVPTVPCPANAVPVESDTDQSDAIPAIDTAESSDDLSSVLEKEETEDPDTEDENVSNSIDHNSTNNLEPAPSENPHSKESPRFFTSLFRTPSVPIMLDYENQMFLDILHEDGLLISAKGLGVETVFLNLIKIYCDPGNLVFVIGTNAEEENYIISELTNQGVVHLPKIITAEKSIAERETIYTEGGVLFISTRIIVVDLLKRRIPIKHITGFLVYRAHKILESCQESFALRLFRLENKTGFVKAFSSSPESFTRGFCRVERVMKPLFVRNLYLWPRFQAVVNSSLERCKPEVIELHLQLTPPMLELQTALLDLIGYVVKEVKRINPVLDTDEVTVENALSKSFHRLLQIQLDPVWHQLSSATKQLLADLKTLRHVLLSLTQTDSVRFNNLVTSLRSTEYAHRSSGWVLMDSAETLFVTAEKRLNNSKGDVDPEPNPKWKALDEILKEVRGTSSCEPEVVLILVSSIETCRQLKDYLVKGPKQMLADLYKRFFGNKDPGIPNVDVQEQEDADNDCFTLSQQTDSASGGISFTECTQDNIGVEPVIIIQPFKKENDVLSLPKTLGMHKPRFVVMYDADVTAIRQIEVFQSNNIDIRMVVYFLIYAGAVEEQAYLTTLRRERSAFEFLIGEKSTMVVPAEQDGKSGDCPELSRDSGKSATAATAEFFDSRKGGLPQPRSNSLVIVDMREFRSELPVLLHRRGIDIDPVTLQIGDYILSPDMCVERKSINDLVGSLNSGRLYQQATAMTRYYAKPMLLIEFDQNKPFDLQGRYYLSRDLSSTDITAKLQLLTLHFPKLKIVWSPSPYATAQLFQEIKEGRPEPDVNTAVAVGLEEGNCNDDKYNSSIMDFINKLPGVTTQNVYSILNNAESLENLLTFTKEDLKKVLQNAAQCDELYNALHRDFKNTPAPSATIKSKKPRGFRAINKKK